MTCTTDFFSCRCVGVTGLHVLRSLLLCLLVSCTTEEISFSSCRLMEVTSSRIAVLASIACLFLVRLRKSVFQVADSRELLQSWLVFLSRFLSMLVVHDLYDSSFQLPLPRSEILKYWYIMSNMLFLCFDRPVRPIFAVVFISQFLCVFCAILWSSLFHCCCPIARETWKTSFPSSWVTKMEKERI